MLCISRTHWKHYNDSLGKTLEGLCVFLNRDLSSFLNIKLSLQQNSFRKGGAATQLRAQMVKWQVQALVPLDTRVTPKRQGPPSLDRSHWRVEERALLPWAPKSPHPFSSVRALPEPWDIPLTRGLRDGATIPGAHRVLLSSKSAPRVSGEK